MELLSNSLSKCHKKWGESRSLYKPQTQVSYLETADVWVVKKWCVVRGEDWGFTSELLKLKNSSLLGCSNILKPILQESGQS